eukprot:5303436-Lingulodinium_polyedra.AAC.1
MALGVVADGAWRRLSGTIADRARVLTLHPSSMAACAEQWSSHCISAAPCGSLPRPDRSPVGGGQHYDGCLHGQYLQDHHVGPL